MSRNVRNCWQFSDSGCKEYGSTAISVGSEDSYFICVAEHFLLIALRKFSFSNSGVVNGDKGLILRFENRVFVINLGFNASKILCASFIFRRKNNEVARLGTGFSVFVRRVNQ